MTKGLVGVALAAVILAGCHPGRSTRSDASIDAGSDASPREVDGTLTLRYFGGGPDGGVDQPVDLSEATLGAGWLGPDGVYRVTPGTGDATGRFGFAAVGGPVAELSLGDGTTYVTGATTVDVRHDVAGRPGVGIASAGTALAVDLDGLSPWQTGDELVLAAPSVGLYQRGIDAQAITPGATSASGLAIAADYFPLFLDTDAVTLLQLRADSSGNLVAIAGGTLAPVTLTDGGTAVSAVTMADLPQDQADLDWDVPSFLALGPDIDARATRSDAVFAIAPAPGGTQPFAVPFLATAHAGTTRLQETIAFGDPYPASWPRYVATDLTFAVPRVIEGLSITVLADATVVTTGGGTIRASIGPPGGLTVDGMTAPGTVGPNPVLSWQPPTLGQPDGYVVELEHVDLARASAYAAAEYLVAPDIHEIVLTIPFKGTFVAVVGAVSDPGSDFATRPNDRSLNRARTDAVSTTFSY